MIVILAALYLVVPAIIATLYAVIWPGVSSRIPLFITLGALSGGVVALGTLFWVVQPLIGVGISGARPGQRSVTLWSLLGSRGVAGILIETVAVCLLLVALSRWLRSP
jgi:hypothetical protein